MSSPAALADHYRRAAHALRNGKPAATELQLAAADLADYPALLAALTHEAFVLDANHAAAMAAFTAGDIFTDPAAAATARAAYDRVADLLA